MLESARRRKAILLEKRHRRYGRDVPPTPEPEPPGSADLEGRSGAWLEKSAAVGAAAPEPEPEPEPELGPRWGDAGAEPPPERTGKKKRRKKRKKRKKQPQEPRESVLEPESILASLSSPHLSPAPSAIYSSLRGFDSDATERLSWRTAQTQPPTPSPSPRKSRATRESLRGGSGAPLAPPPPGYTQLSVLLTERWNKHPQQRSPTALVSSLPGVGSPLEVVDADSLQLVLRPTHLRLTAYQAKNILRRLHPSEAASRRPIPLAEFKRNLLAALASSQVLRATGGAGAPGGGQLRQSEALSAAMRALRGWASRNEDPRGPAIRAFRSLPPDPWGCVSVSLLVAKLPGADACGAEGRRQLAAELDPAGSGVLSASQLLEGLAARSESEGRNALRLLMATMQRRDAASSWGQLFRRFGTAVDGGCLDVRRFSRMVEHCLSLVGLGAADLQSTQGSVSASHKLVKAGKLLAPTRASDGSEMESRCLRRMWEALDSRRRTGVVHLNDFTEYLRASSAGTTDLTEYFRLSLCSAEPEPEPAATAQPRLDAAAGNDRVIRLTLVSVGSDSDDEGLGQTWEVRPGEEPLLMGRGEVGLPATHVQLHRRHARLGWEAGRPFVSRLGKNQVTVLRHEQAGAGAQRLAVPREPDSIELQTADRIFFLTEKDDLMYSAEVLGAPTPSRAVRVTEPDAGLSKLTKRQLRQRATAVGVAPAMVQQAIDGSTPKADLIALISSALSPEPEPEPGTFADFDVVEPGGTHRLGFVPASSTAVDENRLIPHPQLVEAFECFAQDGSGGGELDVGGVHAALRHLSHNVGALELRRWCLAHSNPMGGEQLTFTAHEFAEMVSHAETLSSEWTHASAANRAAITVQAWYRGWRLRRELEEEQWQTVIEAGSGEAELPDGWEPVESRSTGLTYFANRLKPTETSFEWPTEPAEDERTLPPGWEAVWSQTSGSVFYHHAASGRSTYTHPADLSGHQTPPRSPPRSPPPESVQEQQEQQQQQEQQEQQQQEQEPQEHEQEEQEQEPQQLGDQFAHAVVEALSPANRPAEGQPADRTRSPDRFAHALWERLSRRSPTQGMASPLGSPIQWGSPG